LQKKELKESHIISEWAYKNVYGDKHRMINFSMFEKKLYGYKQKGTKEFLFCADCENYFSKMENYAKQFFYSVMNNEFKNIKISEIDSDRLLIKGADYVELKNFFLSILFRMVISTDEMFKYYHLEANKLENIRIKLHTREMVPITFYPMVLAKPYFNDIYVDNIIMTQSKNGENYGYPSFRVMFSGMYILVLLSEFIGNLTILGNALKAGEFILHKVLINNHIDEEFLVKTYFNNEKVRNFYGE
jgi:hypothetical protein